MTNGATMNNRKRWTLGPTGIFWGPLVETSATVMEVSEHNADLESLAQELEKRAKAEQELRDRALSYGAADPIDAVGGAIHAATRDALREAAQLVRAKVEEGGK